MSDSNAIETIFDDESMHVGQVYAKAILAAAAAEGKVDIVVDQLESLVVDILNNQPVLAAFFADPKKSIEEKVVFIDKAFGHSAEACLIKSLKVIARRRRLAMLPSIQQAVAKMRDEALGRMPVLVTSASPLSQEAINGLRDRLKQILNADVSVSTKVDPAILGGLLVRVGDTVFDGSVDGRLEQMRKATKAKAEQTMREKLSFLTA
jgi:F-type H+-transporting ATPase subunit delta